jgi:hypothetical protein
MTNEIKSSFFDKLKSRWGIQHNWEILVILLVFSITGSLSVKVGKPILDFLNIHKESMNALMYWPLRILVSFVAYQVLLVAIGTLLGQHKFFWGMEKKMLRRFGIKL